jgi:hypothetical protein
MNSLWLLILYGMPYILFYIGFGLHLGSKIRSDYFTAARYENVTTFLFDYNVDLYRIVLAIDLEMWYLFSLRFVSGVRVLGPKLYMIRDMVIIITYIFDNNLNII